jgi:hypothetical protein
MKKAEKDYKKQMDVSMKKHRKEMTKKIKNVRSNNSKEFWKLMRKVTYRKQPNISIDTLFDFFKTLNQNPTNDGDGETVLPEIDENLVNNLNIEINGHTSEEILHCVKNLKNEKACGDDIIKNEYIKSSIDVFLTVYLKLFNCIFDSRYYP